jgi:ribosome-associated protein
MDTSQPTIQLDQFLKVMGIAQTGGQAKLLIQSGEVQLNGVIETRRRKKLVTGDRVTTMGETFTVDLANLKPEFDNL